MANSGITLEELGLEQIARQTLMILYANINSAIAAVNTLWDARDSAFYTALGRTDPSHTVETVAPENFYVGHVPSLIDAPVTKYPNVAVMASESRPGGSTDDNAELRPTTVAVELMVKSEAVPPEKEFVAQLEVNARILRFVEAAHAVLIDGQNRTLGGTVPAFAAAPTVTISDAFVRREEKSRGDRWFWQGARMEYIVDKYQSY